MAEWTKDQSNQVTALYKQLNGEYEREAYQKLFGGPQLPYEKARSTLLGIIKKQEAKQYQSSGLEAKTKNPAAPSDSGKTMQYAVGLMGVLAAVAALSIGVPYAPPPLY